MAEERPVRPGSAPGSGGPADPSMEDILASIRRILVITLETSQAHEPGKWNPDAQALLSATMIELSVLGGLILVMVISIAVLRLSEHYGDKRS